MTNLKDKLTNVIAIVLIIAGSIDAYIQSIGEGDINWIQLVLYVGGAIVAWFTGKSANGTKKQI